MLSKLKNSGIVGMKSAWADKTYYYILLDYAINGDLTHFLNVNGKWIKILYFPNQFFLKYRSIIK